MLKPGPKLSRRWLLAAGAFGISAFSMGIDSCEDTGEPPAEGVFFVYDVTDYRFTFDVTTGAAASQVTLVSLSDGDCLALDFRVPPVANVLIDGVAPTWQSDTDDVLELCGAWTTAGSVVTITSAQTVDQGTVGATDVGYSVTRDASGGSFYYLVSWVEGCSLFGPCYDSPNDFAHYRFEVTHPAGYTLLCPGQLTPGDASSACDFMMEGAPTYTGFGFMVSKSWKKVSLGTMAGVEIEFYDETLLNATAKINQTAFSGFLSWIQQQLGEYPFGTSLRFALGPTYWWGFEHPGNIALAESLVNASGSYQDPLLHVMMHETTHQWAGNETTLQSSTDFVWKEAMAEYIPFVYESEHLSASYAARTLAVWTSNSLGVSYYPVPEGNPSVFDFYGDVYGPGPMVLFRQLEVLFGRDKVLAALQSVLGNPRFLTVTALQDALEQAIGQDLDEYFDEWVFGSGAPVWPTVGVSYSDPEGDGTYTVSITQNQGNGVVYGFKSTLRFRGSSGQTKDLAFSYGAAGTAPTLNLTFTPGFVPTSVDVDPYDQALVTAKGVPLSELRFDFRPF